MNIQVRSDRSLVGAAGAERYIVATLMAPRVESSAERAPVNVAFVIDRSGSMAGDKLRLALTAVERAIGMLSPNDRFAVVAYDDRVAVMTPSTLATAEARRIAAARIAEIREGGSTNLSGGWTTGCEQIAQHLEAAAVGRCFLLTDGLANAGITGADELAHHARELRARGIATSTFGIGDDFDERLLQGMAQAGRGNFYYIAREQQIPAFFASELGESMEIVARDVRLSVSLPIGSSPELLSRFDSVLTSDGLVLQIGDLVSGEEIPVVLKLAIGAAKIGATHDARFVVEASDALPVSCPFGWRVATAEDVSREQPDRDVQRRVAELQIARARDKALELNRAGDFAAASSFVASAASALSSLAPDDEHVVASAQALLRESEEFAQPFSAMDAKARHFASHTMLKGRTAEGRARRGPES